MDATEQGFLQALREDPLDRTTRLVYADWLADRDDPRGDFLREEAELAALPSGEVRARELQARLGHVAMTFDPEWVTDVSLVAHRLFGRWRDLEKSFVRYDENRQSDVLLERCDQWQRAIKYVSRRFAERFPTLTVSDRFRIPLDYTLFQIVIGSGWLRDDGHSDELRMLSIDDLLESVSWLSWTKEHAIGASGLWLSLAHPWSDYYDRLCCDRLHFAFGSVYRSEDDNGPWELSIDSMTRLAPSFLDYLRTITP